MKKVVYLFIFSLFTTLTHAQIYVNKNATGSNNGTSWQNAFVNLQDAIALNTSEIWVAQGTYFPHASDRTINFTLGNNTKIYGGFNGTETLRSQRNPVLNKVTLSGDLSQNDNTVLLTTEPTRQENSYNIFYVIGAGTGIIVDGVSITGANSNGSSSLTTSGAIVLNVAYGSTISTLFNNVIIENNTANDAAVFRGFSPTTNGSSAVLEFFVENSIIRNNYCTSMSNCVFTGTHANSWGQNVYDRVSGGFKNTLFHDNTSVNAASCIANRVNGGNGNFSPLQVFNCTFSNNTGINGNVISMVRAGTGLFKNNIVYGNNAGSPIFFNNSGAIGTSWVNNIVSDAAFGTNADPLFLNVASRDYRFDCSANSPAINTGNMSGITLPTIDLAGNARQVGTVDMGAYEYRAQLEISASATEICAGDQITLTALNGTGNSWSNGVQNGIAFAPAGNQTYSLTGTDENNCVHTKTIAIYVTNLNEKPVSATPTSICAGQSSVVTVQNADDGILYKLVNNTTGLPVGSSQVGTGGNLTFSTGTVNTTTTFSIVAESKAPVALDFDGTNDYLSTNAKLPTTNTFTVESWILPRATNNRRILSSYSGGGAVLAGEFVIDTYHTINNGRALRFYISGAGNAIAIVDAANVLTLNTWNHIACVFNNGVMTIHVNGVLVGTNTAPFTSFPGGNTYSVNIAEDRLLGAAEYFNGKIDEIRFWNTAKTPAQIQASMSTCLAGNEAGLINYMNMTIGESGGTTCLDKSSNGYLATLQNMDVNTDWVSGAFNCVLNQAECSKTLAQTATISISDNTAPVANAASLPTLTNSCSIASLTAPTATDNCAGQITATHSTLLPITSSTTITWTYNDGNGNTSTQTQSAVINDVSAPVANVGSLPTLTNQCSITSLTAPTATDNCAGQITATHNATLPITSSTAITWTYNDGNGNTSTQTQSVTINDVTAPVANVGSLPTLTNQCSITSLTAPTATDNCAGQITATHNATLPITSSTTITWTYNDGNGNTSTQTQSVAINDVTAPVANVGSLPTLTNQCSITSLTAPTATDNCAGQITATHNATLPITVSATITWTYNDGNGNTSTQTQSVAINDVTAPVANAGSLPTLTNQCSITSLTAPTATDNCAGQITATHNATLPITSSNTITWTYNDGNGNTSTQTQSVTINDVTAPVANVGSLPTLTNQCSITSLTAPTATDNCAGQITATHNATFPISSTTTITWTYADGNGNTSTQTQNVVINDVTAPVANLATLPTISGQCEITSLTAPTATDNCNGSITGTHAITLPISTQGTTLVTWTYNDGNGNTSSQTQNVVIQDNTAPVANSGSLSDVQSECEVTALVAPMATDNCSGQVTGTHNAILPISAQGTTVVTWTYTDAVGNNSTQTQNVVILDVTSPIADNATLTDLTDQCSIGSLTAPTATDNCTGQIIATHNVTLPITSSTTITWTYADGNGNSTTQQQNVVITDAIAPIADVSTLPEITATCSLTQLTAPTATDNCAGMILGTSSSSLPINSTTTVTWMYDDGNGNTSTQTQLVTINQVDETISVVNNVLSANNTGADTYQWVDCANGNAPISGETGITFTPTVNGSYGVVITQDGCTVSSGCETISSLSIKDNHLVQLSVYPNPARDIVTIDANTEINSVAILNSLGQLVQTEYTSSFSVSGLSNGIYFLSIATDHGIVQQKIIKE